MNRPRAHINLLPVRHCCTGWRVCLWSLLISLSCGAMATAQSTAAPPVAPLPSQPAFRDKKPSEALRHWQEQQRKVFAELEKTQKDPELNELREVERERREEQLRVGAQARAAQFKMTDWHSDELAALATLYALGEQFGQSALALQQLLKEGPPTSGLSGLLSRSQAYVALFNLRFRRQLASALLQDQQLEAAAMVLEQLNLEASAPELPQEIILKEIAEVADLAYELAQALRVHGRAGQAADVVLQGFATLEGVERQPKLAKLISEEMRRRELSLAALAQAALEQLSDRKRLAELETRLTATGLRQNVANRLHFNEELALARLIGKPALELVVQRWLVNEARTTDSLRLAALRGRVILLDFFAMWSVPSQWAYPQYQNWATKYGAQGLSLLSVTRFYGRSESRDELTPQQEWDALRQYRQRHQITWPMAVSAADDLTNEERFGVIGPPTTVLIDRRGYVRLIKRGGGDYRQLLRQVERLLKENV